MAAYRLACTSSKSLLVKLCAFWVRSEAFMSVVPGFILDRRRTLHFYDECMRAGLPWCALGCGANCLSQRTTTSPNLYLHLLSKGPRKPCAFENAGSSWRVLMQKLWAVGNLAQPVVTIRAQQQENEPGERGLRVSLLFTLFSAVLQENPENRSRSLHYVYSPSSLVCRAWGFMYVCLLFFVLFIII